MHMPTEQRRPQTQRSARSGWLGFNGELLESSLERYQLGRGYRAYSPVLMRFNNPDELSPFGRGGLNGYAYCLGDPVNLVDPDGQAGVSWLMAKLRRLFTPFSKGRNPRPLPVASSTGANRNPGPSSSGSGPVSSMQHRSLPTPPEQSPTLSRSPSQKTRVAPGSTETTSQGVRYHPDSKAEAAQRTATDDWARKRMQAPPLKLIPSAQKAGANGAPPKPPRNKVLNVAQANTWIRDRSVSVNSLDLL